MAKTARDVIDLVQTKLQDLGATSWPEAELLDDLNDGQREIVKYKPDANPVGDVQQLVAGTRQTLPAGSVSLIDVPRNMGTDGATPGPAIIEMPRQVLDTTLPNWHTAIPSAVVQFYCFDERDPKAFWVFPPQPATGQGHVQQLRADNPADCTLNGVDGETEDSALSIADEYANDLFNFIMDRALGKETDEASAARALPYRQKYMQSLGIKEAAEMKTEPRRGKAPQAGR